MERKALVVGINRYPFPIDESQQIRQLDTSAGDAETIAHYLETYGDFRVRRLPETFDSEGKPRVDPMGPVRLPELQAAIEELFNPPSQSVSDTALLFFAGHGLRRGKGAQAETFLVTSDVYYPGESLGLSLQWLRELLQSSPVRQQLVWLDCCHSGALFNFTEQALQTLSRKQDRSLIAASKDYELAYESFGGDHGLLAGALIKGLDPSQWPEGYVTNYTLADFVQERLKAAPQSPQAYNFGGEIILTGTKEKIDPLLLRQTPCPYKGLESFEFSDADYFFGRAQLVGELVDRLDERNFLAVLGASGSGKSSLVKAGVLPAFLKQQRERGDEGWRFCVFRPGAEPMKSLARGVTDESVTTSLLEVEKTLQPGVEGLKELVRKNFGSGLILVVDQFEEVFTLCSDAGERQRFLSCLLDPLADGELRLKVILTLRIDFLSRCLESDHPTLGHIEDHLAIVKPLRPDENAADLEDAIVKPAQKVGLEVQPELVEQILDDVKGPGSLPLLQYALRELWENRQVNRLTVAEYSRIGGVKGALKQRAEAIYNADLAADKVGEQLSSEEEQLVAQRIFLELTRLGEGTEDTRRQVLKETLLSLNSASGLVDRVLKKLTDARLVVTSELRSWGEGARTVTVVDIAHESLIQNWPRLTRWIEENRQALRQKRWIEADAQQWVRVRRRRDYLLQGLRLDEAIEFQKQFGETVRLLNPAPDYVRRSRDRRFFNRLVGMGLAAAVVLALSGAVIYSRGQAVIAQQNTARADEKTTEAEESAEAARNAQQEAERNAEAARNAQRETEVEKTRAEEALKSAEAEKERAEAAEANAQEKAAIAERQRIRAEEQTDIATQQRNEAVKQTVLAKVGEQSAVAVNWLASSKAVYGLVLAIDAVDLAQRNLLPHEIPLAASSSLLTGVQTTQEKNRLQGHERAVLSVAFSGDGRRIVSGSNDDTVRLWDVETGQLIGDPLQGHQDAVNSVTFSGDDRRIVSGSDDNTIRLWDAETGEPIGQPLQGHEDAVNSVAFSGDGRRIVSGSRDGAVRLWDAETGEPIGQPLQGHNGVVLSVAFSGDGRRIVSGGHDATVRLWDAETGQPIGQPLQGHEDSIRSVAFSPDGRRIVSGSRDDIIRLWDGDWSGWLALACNRLQYHPLLIQPETVTGDGEFIKVAGRARAACEERVWGGE